MYPDLSSHDQSFFPGVQSTVYEIQAYLCSLIRHGGRETDEYDIHAAWLDCNNP